MSKVNAGKWKIVGSGLVAICIFVYLMLFIKPNDSSGANNFRLTYGSTPDKFTKNIDKLAAEQLRHIVASNPAGESPAMVHASAELYSHSLPHVPPLNVYKEGHSVVLSTTSETLPNTLALVQWIRGQDQFVHIEVYVSDWANYEPAFCAEVFPGMDVQCRVLTDIYGEHVLRKVEYLPALKYLAMLASPFENVAYMESPTLSMVSPSHVFGSSSFNSSGLVLLPSGATSHFEAGAIDVPDCYDTHIYLSKNRHFSTLLLAAYYAVWNLSYNPASAAATVLSKDYAFAEMVKSDSGSSVRLENTVIAWHPNQSVLPEGTEARGYGDLNSLKALLGTEEDIEKNLCDINRYLVCGLAIHFHHIPKAWKTVDLGTRCGALQARVAWLAENS